MCKIAISLLLPFLFCGDEITDILYLFFNWDSFGNEAIKYSALSFTLINAFVNLVCSIIILGNVTAVKNADGLKKIALFVFCGWFPIIAIMYFLVYFKFVELALRFEIATQSFLDIRSVKQLSRLLHYS
jgi:hypothetical protein